MDVIKAILSDKECDKVKTLFSEDTYQEAILRIIESKATPNNYRSYFFIVARNIHLAAKQLPPEISPPDNYNPTIYQRALDNFLQKNDNIFGYVVQMYLICPNLSKLSRDTGINKQQIKDIFYNARNRIGFEYITLLSTDSDLDSYNTI
jgi:cyclophilin family peptidyl-prolyl cis-trans isomerase